MKAIIIKILCWPFVWVAVRHDVQTRRGEWIEAVRNKNWEQMEAPSGFEYQGAHRNVFYYNLKVNGHYEYFRVLVYVQRRVWKRRWFKWVPFWIKNTESIHVDANDRFDSVDFETLSDETPSQALARMEKSQ